MKQDLFKGNSHVGLIVPTLNRRQAEDAYSGGLDWNLNWRDESSSFWGQIAGSRAGPRDGRTSGWGNQMVLEKQSGWLRGELWWWAFSREFDISDLGYQQRSDYYEPWLWVQARQDDPWGPFRRSLVPPVPPLRQRLCRRGDKRLPDQVELLGGAVMLLAGPRGREIPMEVEKDMSNAVVDWATGINNVRVAILTSSRTNPNLPVDFLSDYDIELFVLDLQPFLASDAWLERFGSILVRWPHEPRDYGDATTRLVLYEDAPRIDFQIKKIGVLSGYVSELPDFYDIGYEVLLDKDGAARGLAPPIHTVFQTQPPTELEYRELTRHFWWNITYVAKYLHRDELFFAKYMLDDAVHHKYLHTALAWSIGMHNQWRVNPGAQGRWFKRYLAPDTWSDVEATFAGADLAENWEAMFKATQVFRRLTTQVGTHLGYEYPTDLDQRVTAYLQKIRKLGRS